MFGRLRRSSPAALEVARSNAVLLKKHWPVHRVDRNAKSHLGGDPILPLDASWPTCTFEGEEHTMHFLAQIDCAELPDFEDRALLPTSGVLAFFLLVHEELGAEADNICAVRYIPSTATRLQRRPPPPGLIPVAKRTSDDRFRDYLPPAEASL